MKLLLSNVILSSSNVSLYMFRHVYSVLLKSNDHWRRSVALLALPSIPATLPAQDGGGGRGLLVPPPSPPASLLEEGVFLFLRRSSVLFSLSSRPSL